MPYNLNLTFGTWFELLLAVLLTIAAAKFNRFGRVVWVVALQLSSIVGRRPGLMLVLAAIVPVIIRLLLLVVDPVPQPYVMEEFNHLFLADTYSLGRLANPVHPLAVMIQSYQQVEWPHYMSGRPPLPPIFLFVGQVLLGSPFAGNLLAVALTSSALCWMLQGWVPGRWSVLGSVMAIVSFCLFGYWVNSYWAPTTMVLGGAILMGLVPRIEKRPLLIWAGLFVIALLLLAGTRPYENGVYAVTICIWLAVHFLRREGRPQLIRAIIIVAIPVAVGVCVIFAAQLWYNYNTTGNYSLMPYQIWRASQDVTPLFLWQPMAEVPKFYYSGAARFSAWNVKVVEDITEGGLWGLLLLFGRQAVTFRDLLGPFLFLPFLCWSHRWLPAPNTNERTTELLAALCVVLVLLALGGPVASTVIKAIVIVALIKRWENEDERLPALLLLVGLIATSLPTFYMNIYFAAFTAPMLILVMKGLRYLSLWHRPYGQSLAGYMLLGAAIMPLGQAIALGAGAVPRGPSLSHFNHIYGSPRRAVIDKLQNLPGQHVVFVRSSELVPVTADPVWNAPDIDTQKIVWLRDLRPEWSATAQEYYHGRKFWLMELKTRGIYRLKPFPAGSLPAPLPLASLPNPDRAAAESLGARMR